jgi:hypothetical protein
MNLTPNQKAKELLDKFIPPTRVQDIEENWVDDLYYAKQCALIAVEEILNKDNAFIQTNLQNTYWQEVKTEIEKF